MNRPALTILLTLATTSIAHAANTPITTFTKTDNIFTNLNMQFPHTDTGSGIPGSGVGTPNASFLFNPSPTAVANAGYAPNYLPTSNLVNNGITFTLTSDNNGRDFTEIPAGSTLTTPTTAINHASAVYLLGGAFFNTSNTITFTGLDGHTESFSSIPLPDFNGSTMNTSGATPTPWFAQTLFQTHDVGAGGTGNSTTGDTTNYDLTELGFTLDNTFTHDPLTSISITTNSGGTSLLYAITANTLLLGDANEDGKVDLSDLNIVLNNLGTTNPNWTSGNFDGQPTIDLTDLNDVLNNLGTSSPNSVLSTQSSPLSSPTPEPTSLSLLALATLPLLRRRR